MSITLVATATPEPLTHPIWCNQDRCINAEGESMLHKHIIGSIGGVTVTVERIDDYDANYQPRAGRVEVNVYSRENGLTRGQPRELARLVELADVFAAEVAR